MITNVYYETVNLVIYNQLWNLNEIYIKLSNLKARSTLLF